jgi:hypothetical protein
MQIRPSDLALPLNEFIRRYVEPMTTVVRNGFSGEENYYRVPELIGQYSAADSADPPVDSERP